MLTEDNSEKILVGVVGRLGAGKSAFSKMLALHGASLLEADKIAWKLYDIPAVKKDIRAAFSGKVFDIHGKVDRKKLGEIVFADPDALKRLNAIVHPPLIGELEYQISRTSKEVVVIDAALLLDWPLAESCDLLIAVAADEDTSIQRLEEKKVRPRRSRAILASQRDEAEFRKLCHVIVENDGSLEDLRVAAEGVWKKYVEPMISRH
ncbi:dephospho-CoA kinase [candidate division WOR-3 bacterium]|uniref:Dephospho-CoA kinase n=1 Tax=candidate division WOR-3 bacterium TaxID=2052148 RepID=A0A9D5KAJ0_UNCW3|nr:dephospho-CoA kinase [candidate division WOR-3 bacterium]MBD3365401.1 dephospho-CoA kinase [candidate division WOR-3 bacterium]